MIRIQDLPAHLLYLAKTTQPWKCHRNVQRFGCNFAPMDRDPQYYGEANQDRAQTGRLKYTSEAVWYEPSLELQIGPT